MMDPPSENTAAEWPQLVCPSCRASLDVGQKHSTCADCTTTWSVDDGIPLLFPDQYQGDAGMSEEMFDVLFRSEDEGHFLFYGRMLALEQMFLPLVRAKPGLRTLDIGCGTGYALRRLAELGAQVAGLDASVYALSLARQRNVARLFGGSAERLPFDDGQFDLIICLDVLEHVQDDRAVLREIRRVLAVGGACILFVPAGRLLWSRCDEIVKHKRRYSRRELTQKLSEAGFCVKQVAGLFPMFVLPVLLARTVHRLFMHGDNEMQAVLAQYSTPAPWLNSLMKRIAWAEAQLVPRLKFPYGTSLVAQAFKDSVD